MNDYRQTGNLKAALFSIGVIIIVGVLWYSQTLVKELQNNERKLLDIYAHLITRAASEGEAAEIGFVFEEVIQNIEFPVVITSKEGEIVSYRNLDIDPDLPTDQINRQVSAIVDRMDAMHPPVDVLFEDIIVSRLHYGDSSMVSRLRWLPYLEIIVVGLFILLGFAGFSIIRNSEEKSIWTGMARETAHQLGTPVSSLMGWLAMLRSNPDQTEEIVGELETDTHRLVQIADRFQKVGSVPKFAPVDLHDMAEASANYFRSRLPSRSETLITVEGKSTEVAGAETLLQWALENLLKNAIDACQGVKGDIRITVTTRDGVGSIEVRDNGSGISARDKRNIFRPGFSTKQRGWGLGLSLTRRIVEDIHPGSLKLVSSRPGETIIRMSVGQ